MSNAPARGHWLREPLLHFLVAGAAIFVLYYFVRGNGDPAPRAIVVNDARIEALAENFGRTWMRPPTPAELRGLVDDFVKEDVFYREAIAMGLDRDDTVIRRRLRQKMEFLSEAPAAATEPTDAQLQQFLADHAAQFTEPASVTFQQVYVNTSRRGAAATAAAVRILADLQAGRVPATDPAAAGDPTLLPAGLQDASQSQVVGTFGEDFARELEQVPVGRWSGPVKSSFGLHLVHVDSRSAGALPALNDIRPVVLREWQAAQRAAGARAFYEAMRAKYDVRYDGELGKLLQQGQATLPSGSGPQ